MCLKETAIRPLSFLYTKPFIVTYQIIKKLIFELSFLSHQLEHQTQKSKSL